MWLRGRRLSPSMVVSVVALVVACGGTGYAAVRLPHNSVGPGQIKPGAVRSSDVRNGALSTADLSSSAKRSLKGQIGPVGPAGVAGPQGPAGVTAFHELSGSAVSMCGSGGGGCQVALAEASCPSGEVATGGGWNSDSIDMTVSYSRRTAAGKFSVIGINYDATSSSLTAQVICARGPAIASAKIAAKRGPSPSSVADGFRNRLGAR